MTTKDKTIATLKNDIIDWVDNTAMNVIHTYYKANLTTLIPTPLSVKFGNKFAQVWQGRIIWAFIALTDDATKNQLAGDLLKPKSWRAPAKKSRGNILDGTANFGPYGPTYLT